MSDRTTNVLLGWILGILAFVVAAGVVTVLIVTLTGPDEEECDAARREADRIMAWTRTLDEDSPTEHLDQGIEQLEAAKRRVDEACQ